MMFLSVSLSSQSERINKKEERGDHQSLILAETFFFYQKIIFKGGGEKKSTFPVYYFANTRPLTQMQN